MNTVTDGLSFLQPTANYVYNTSTLAWVEMQQPVISGGTIVVGSVNQGTGGVSAWLVTASSLPLPTDAATQTTLALIKAKTDNIDVALSTRTKPADTQFVSSKVSLTGSAPTFATVGTSSAIAVASNASRTSLVLTNTSENMIYIGLGATAVIGSGIVIAPYSVWPRNE